MKNVMQSKTLLSVLSLMLIVAMAFSFSACGNNDSDTNTTTTATSTTAEAVSEVGQGEVSFTFQVVEKDDSTVEFKVHTNAKSVGEALVENGLISGSEGDFGLFVDTVNGQKYDYNEDGVYWAFHIDGEYAMSGVDETAIAEGATYSFVATKA